MANIVLCKKIKWSLAANLSFKLNPLSVYVCEVLVQTLHSTCPITELSQHNFPYHALVTLLHESYTIDLCYITPVFLNACFKHYLYLNLTYINDYLLLLNVDVLYLHVRKCTSNVQMDCCFTDAPNKASCSIYTSSFLIEEIFFFLSYMFLYVKCQSN